MESGAKWRVEGKTGSWTSLPAPPLTVFFCSLSLYLSTVTLSIKLNSPKSPLDFYSSFLCALPAIWKPRTGYAYIIPGRGDLPSSCSLRLQHCKPWDAWWGWETFTSTCISATSSFGVCVVCNGTWQEAVRQYVCSGFFKRYLEVTKSNSW